MCWVMPPASPAATSVWRIASSSEVLPWSTWPMIVTTGGRSFRSAASSSASGASISSSAAVTISILRSNFLAIASTDSSGRVCVRVAISPPSISALITSALPRPRLSATSRTVAPELSLIAGVSSGVSGCLISGSSSSGLRRRPPRRRGGRGGGWFLAMWSRRAAWESITTRRRFLPPALGPPSDFCCGTGRTASSCLAPSDLAAGLGFDSAFGLPSALALAGALVFAAAFGFSLVAVAVAEPDPAALSAARASDSSTFDCAAFASTPAALSAASSSLLVVPCAFAIS